MLARDVENPASERKTFAILTLIAGLMLLAPRQWVSGVVLLVLAAVMFVRHRKLSRLESASATPAAPAAVSPGSDGPGSEPAPREPVASDAEGLEPVPSKPTPSGPDATSTEGDVPSSGGSRSGGRP